MKVFIGPYLNWIGPHQIIDGIFFWHEKYPSDELDARWDYRLHDKASDWLSKTWVAGFCQWAHDLRKRKVEVVVHDYDYWSADATLSPIILPLLKKLQKHKHGSGFIDLEDVPESMRHSTTEEYEAQETFEFYKDEKDTQKVKCDIHTRYAWALDEMIWAFEQLNDENWEDQYWITHPEIDLDDYPEDEGKTSKPLRWKVKGECNWEGRQKHQARIDNGLRLFGKYFQTLWD
jgi:hypothetical protein